MKGHPLPPSFFEHSAERVARELLGKYLVKHDKKDHRIAAITEVESYGGAGDEASHAFSGKTPRNTVMFGPAGVWYMYLIYGIHTMANIVTEDDGSPGAVLIRGLEDISGPGRLTRAFGIDRGLYGQPISVESGLWVEDRGIRVPKNELTTTPRVGLGNVSKKAKEAPLRFIWKD